MPATFASLTPNEPARITRFSELGKPIEKLAWWSPFGWLLVFASSMVIIAFLLALSPLILLLIALQHLYKRSFKYHRNPAELKIAIIGAGWGGLQCLERFKKLGVTDVDVFERYDDIGGTWHKNQRYKGLQIHGNMTVTSFDGLPYSTDRDIQGGKVMGEEVENYIHKFTDKFGLRPHVQFHSNVDGVNYKSDKRTATISISDALTGEKRESGPYDMVVWASMAAYADMPEIEGSDIFKGTQLHTTQYKQSEFENIIKNNKKVVVVGGGKASCDVALSFKRAGYQNFTWIMRKPYLFYRFEALLHNGSFVNKIRGVSYLCTVLWCAVSNRFSAILHWASGHLYTVGKNHTDFNHFHGGVMCPTQRKDIRDVPFTIGEVVAFKENCLVLKDGAEMECDVVIWATGNRSGIDTLALTRDGEAFKLEPKAKLYNHFIVPEIPAMASSTALWTSFGPMRATNSADLTVHHLCVRKEKTEKQMKKVASRQMSRNSLVHSFIWAKHTCWLQQWVYFHMDLMLAGITPFESFMKHALEVFVMGNETPLQFKILPATPYSSL